MPLSTRAAVAFETNARIEVVALDLEPPRPGEVLVRVKAAGVCRSDWQLVTGATRHPLPVALGHEGAGVVESVGPGVHSVSRGDRVILNWAPSCGCCFHCRRERPALCEPFEDAIWAGGLLDGTSRMSCRGRTVHHYCALSCFAERIVVPAQACVRIEEDIPDAVAALIGCAVTTGVGAVLRTARVPEGSSAAVFGTGGVGLCIVMGLVLAGARRILAVDTNPRRGKLALELGATRFAAAGEVRGVDFAFDATGKPDVQRRCVDSVRAGGTAVFVGLSPVGSETCLPGDVIARRELTVTGSYYGSSVPARDIPKYVRFYREGRLPLDRLITRTYPLSHINEAYHDLNEGRILRGVIAMP